MLDKNTVTSVQEVERVYRLHHHYDETCEIYGKNAWNIMLRVNILYFSGILALFLVLMYVEDLFIVMAAGLLYMMLFFSLRSIKIRLYSRLSHYCMINVILRHVPVPSLR